MILTWISLFLSLSVCVQGASVFKEALVFDSSFSSPYLEKISRPLKNLTSDSRLEGKYVRVRFDRCIFAAIPLR